MPGRVLQLGWKNMKLTIWTCEKKPHSPIKAHQSLSRQNEPAKPSALLLAQAQNFQSRAMASLLRLPSLLSPWKP
jgi:hypothetical protein